MRASSASASHCWCHGGMQSWWRRGLALSAQQVTVLVINIIRPLMKNNSNSLVAPPFIGIAVTCREIIACSGSQFIWERIRVSTQVVGDVQPKNQISSLGEIFLGFCKGGLRLKRRSKDAQPCVQADPLSTFWVMAFVPTKLWRVAGVTTRMPAGAPWVEWSLPGGAVASWRASPRGSLEVQL